MVDIKENEILTALSAPNTQEAGLSAARDAYGALVRRIIANVLTDPGERGMLRGCVDPALADRAACGT